jgi:hypothetical protein
MAEDRETLREHITLVRTQLLSPIKVDRFSGASKLAARFERIARDWEAGRADASAIVEVVNEIAVAVQLLSLPLTAHFAMIYEPRVTLSGQSIDFLLAYGDDKKYFDVKTIMPRDPANTQRAWEKYGELRQLFPDNASILLAKNLMGGEFWHYFSSARAKFLDYALGLERKIAALPKGDKQSIRMVYCTDGFHWRIDQLEDFADFYQNGVFRADDAFAPLQAHYLTDKGIVIQRTIDGFCCLHRRLIETQPQTFLVDVQGPNLGRF